MALNLADQQVLAQTEDWIKMLRYGAYLRRVLLGMLLDLIEEIADEVRHEHVGDAARESTNAKRAETVGASLRAPIRKRYSEIYFELRRSLRRVARHEASVLGRGLKLVAPVPSAGTLNSQFIIGGTLREQVTRQYNNLYRDVLTQLRIGVVEGETSDQIAKRIEGTTTSRRMSFVREGTRLVWTLNQGGVGDKASRQLRILTLTALESMRGAVLTGFIARHRSRIRGLQAIVTLDNRNNPICIERAGEIWSVNEFPGPPPWHFGCRSWILVLLATDPSPATIVGFRDWINAVGPKKAGVLLGKSRYDLWSNGKLTLARLLDQSGRPLTFEEAVV